MRTMVTRLVIAAVLLAAGEIVRRGALVEDQLAATQEQLIMRPATVTPAVFDDLERQTAFAARLPIVGEPLRREVWLQRALAAYWSGDYATVASLASPTTTAAEEEEADPDLLFVAANAAFRDTVRATRPRQELLRALDDSLRRYDDVLKASPGHEGAAYNYELASRLRTALARGQRTDQLLPDTQPHMQGKEGDPPQGTKPPEFNVIVPMRPDERQDQFDAGVGGVTRRRG